MIIKASPFDERNSNRMALFNEVSVSLYLYVMILLTDSMGETSSSLRESFGWALTILLFSTVLINFVKAIA